MSVQLDPNPPRPLTDTECAKIINPMLAGLYSLGTHPDEIRRALMWTLEHWDTITRAWSALEPGAREQTREWLARYGMRKNPKSA